MIISARDQILKYIGDIAKVYNQDYESNKTEFKACVADLVKVHECLDPLINKYKEYEKKR